MDIETAIKDSEWWQRAKQMPDRHYDPDAGVSLADHLEAVFRNVRHLCSPEPAHDYFAQLRATVESTGLTYMVVSDVLTPVALLHDIGKTREDKEAEIEHPITGKSVRKRHPVVGVTAALELLPDVLDHRDTIVALVDEHDTPYSWYVQFRRSGQVPKRKSWARLDRKISPQEDGTGIMLLCLFKMADIDGHDDVQDVSWFVDKANDNYLRQKGRWLPVPAPGAVESLSKPGP